MNRATLLATLLLIVSSVVSGYAPLNSTWRNCEFALPHVWDQTPPWTSNGDNPIAVAMFGSVSYREKQVTYPRGGLLHPSFIECPTVNISHRLRRG